MSQDGNTGVTEARFALTIVTCLLLALGYITLHRLGGAGEVPPVETGPTIVDQPIGDDDEQIVDDSQPKVLITHGTDGAPSAPRTTQLPERPVQESNADSQTPRAL
jgi:hypothetical protein